MRVSPLFAVVVGLVTVVACGEDDTPATPPSGSTSASSSSGSSGSASSSSSGGTTTSSSSGSSSSGDGGGPTTFGVTSTAYKEGETIPAKYKCKSDGGESKSIPIKWEGAPAGTKSFAVVMRDLDFQNGFVHWAIWDIPEGTTELKEGVANVAEPDPPKGAKQAKFNGTIVGYYGPCSPDNVNTYEITVYAIPTATITGIDTTTAKATVQAEIVKAATASVKIAGES